MKAQENQFLPFLNGKKQFIIPIYQRTYSWQREQCDQLWNDIVSAGTDNEMPGHFIGSVVYIQQGTILFGNVPQFLLIDGQQRLTSLMLLLTSLAEKVQSEPETSNTFYKEDIYDSYIINKFGKEEQRYKLLLTHSDQETLKQIIDHPEKIVPDNTKSFAPLINNYLFFREKLQQREVDLATILSGINKLIIVEISLNKDHDNPQLIFESLNSTGMDLSQADLIRNYVLMGLDAEEQKRIYNEYWYPIEQKFRYGGNGDYFDRFMRDYLTLKQSSIPNIDKVYTTFKQYHRTKYRVTIQEIIKDISRFAEYYANLAFLHEKDVHIKQVMQNINALKVDVAYPFFLEIYDDYKQGKLTRDNLVAILLLIESYVFRRAICGIPTNALNKVFTTLGAEIDKEHYLESLQAALYTRTGSGRFPRDDEFRAYFVTKDVYNSPRRNYLLSKLENYNRKEQVHTLNYTIEHVMPQNSRLSVAWQQELGPEWKDIQTRYLHTIGNLTLTGYNSQLSDRPFHEKKTIDGGFNYSPLRLNQSLAHLEHWNQQAIEKRAQVLADEAIKVWAIPALTTEQTNKYSSKQGRKATLAEFIGPVHDPLAGFVPEGFRLVQATEKRFYVYRQIEGKWIQYGDGKNAFFSTTWASARERVRRCYELNLIPQGAGGEKVNTSISPLSEEEDTDDDNTNKTYTINDHPYLQGEMLALFNELRKRILNLSVNASEEFKKHYVAYKLTSNFVGVETLKGSLLLTMSIPFEEIDDPKGIGEDVTNIGHRGTGQVRVRLTQISQLDDAMYLIQQAFDRQNNEVALV
ncbi:DUF262 and DUF1524 domain-containing protein [Dictyobacter arantiisoli]|uniref:DUF262 domain-containing protein n=1 Tax=Dictyobacter arantiisoli TaxID=2014874 RepID=A0A5A5TIM5_9CHLR|nr:DUF262 and DUF1524 domain-containing protein [Dictyobacter arantiisoli]GCF11075.1 hypothetical protein KDI_46390 [Dictyobacter arantiisoli]